MPTLRPASGSFNSFYKSAFSIDKYRPVEFRSMTDDPEFRRLLLFLLGGSRGGENRARIIRRLRTHPSNMNQLAGDLGLQYKAIQHHVRILMSNSLLVASGERYGMIYSLNPWFEAHIDIFEQVCVKLGFKD
jgi:DNA-binding transcriptional ArsR family regulator